MTVLEVLSAPNIILNQKCDEVETFDPQLNELITDMFDTMKAYDGIGLAAPQVGILQRLFICKFRTQSLVCINPVLELSGDIITSKEACLSLPNLEADVPRHTHVKITAYDQFNKQYTKRFTAMMAIIIQHEYDHLNGVLITDYPTK